jgi:hypothetical protein
MKSGRTKPSMDDRFLCRVQRGPNDCWSWSGPLDRDGYGYFWIGKLNLPAHRFSYIAFVESLEDGVDVHHKCPNKNCVNPEHLEAVDHRAHMRMHSKLDRPYLKGCHITSGVHIPKGWKKDWWNRKLREMNNP